LERDAKRVVVKKCFRANLSDGPFLRQRVPCATNGRHGWLRLYHPLQVDGYERLRRPGRLATPARDERSGCRANSPQRATGTTAGTAPRFDCCSTCRYSGRRWYRRSCARGRRFRWGHGALKWRRPRRGWRSNGVPLVRHQEGCSANRAFRAFLYGTTASLRRAGQLAGGVAPLSEVNCY